MTSATKVHYNFILKLLLNNILLTDKRLDVRAGISAFGTGECVLLPATSAAIVRGPA